MNNPDRAPALLPPDPDRPGRYWLSHNGGPPDIWEWCVEGCGGVGGWMSGNSEGHPHDMAVWGYTLATPHPIPGPAALEAVYQVVETLLDVANLSVITPQDEIHVGPVIYAASGAQVKALRDAAAMLRAALETKETT